MQVKNNKQTFISKIIKGSYTPTREYGMLFLYYRVTYGTLLGAVRSSAIIPYSDDIDLAVRKKDNDNFSRFIALQNHLGSKYRVIWKAKPPISRVYPHFTPTVEVSSKSAK